MKNNLQNFIKNIKTFFYKFRCGSVKKGTQTDFIDKLRFRYKKHVINIKIKKTKQLLDNILLELQKTTYEGVSEFVIENGYGKFKYLDCEFYIKKRIGKQNQRNLIGEFKLYQNTQSSFPPNAPILEEIENFGLIVYPNGQMFIPNYIDFPNPKIAPTLTDGHLSLNFSDVSRVYFNQLENKIIKEKMWLYIGE